MNKKYFFFDIDGTLTIKGKVSYIPKSVVKTLKKLRDNGHFVAIATGRAQVLSKEFAAEVGVNNIVSDGGNGLTLNGELVDIEPLDNTLALSLIDEALSKNFRLGVSVNNTTTLYSRDMDTSLEKYYDIVIDPNYDFHKQDKIFKIFIQVTEEEEHKIDGLHNLGYMRYIPESILIEPDEKYRGIRRVMEHLNAPIKDVVVFGDGHNDISMFKAAPFSIAMGNAIDELKEIASFVTKTNVEDGIEYACKHFNWI